MRVNKRQRSEIPLGILRLLILLIACAVGLSASTGWTQELAPSEPVGDDTEAVVETQAQEPVEEEEFDTISELPLPEYESIESVSTGSEYGQTSEEFYKARTKYLGSKGQILIRSLDLIEADLGNVLRAIGKIADLNVIAGEDIRGTVTVYWKDVTVQQALESILTANEYAYYVENNVLHVVSASKLGEDKVRTVTRVIVLQYINPEVMKKTIDDLMGGGQQQSGGSGGAGDNRQRVEVGTLPDINAVVISGVPREVEELEKIIKEMDKKPLMVRIDARFVEFNCKEAVKTGMEWYVNKDLQWGNYSKILSNFNLGLINPGQATSTSAGNLVFGYASDALALMAFLQATAERSRVRVLANPNILVANHTMAKIDILDERPYVTTNVSQGVITESVNYRETGIKLEVVPHITEDDSVLMSITPVQQVAGPSVVLQNSTAFGVATRRTTTELLVRNGEPVAIGGLRMTDQQSTRKKVPIVGDMPLIGKLFQRNEVEDNETELVVFITPYVVRDALPPLSSDHAADMRQSDWPMTRIVDMKAEERGLHYQETTPVYSETKMFHIGD